MCCENMDLLILSFIYKPKYKLSVGTARQSQCFGIILSRLSITPSPIRRLSTETFKCFFSVSLICVLYVRCGVENYSNQLELVFSGEIRYLSIYTRSHKSFYSDTIKSLQLLSTRPRERIEDNRYIISTNINGMAHHVYAAVFLFSFVTFEISVIIVYRMNKSSLKASGTFKLI